MSDLGGFSLFELFAEEAQAACAVLDEGLLALESSPGDVARIEPLMRAAHSIKGAARIVGLDVVVELAHAMEDCFVAAQKGTEQLVATRIDQLLQGVDLLGSASGLTEADAPGWSDANRGAVAALVALLRAAAPAEAASPAAPTPAPTPSPAPAAAREQPAEDAAAPEAKPEPEERPEEEPPTEQAAPAADAPRGDDAWVRVSGAALTRLMRFAGESMIATRRLQALGPGLAPLRATHRRLAAAVEGAGTEDPEQLHRLVAEAEERLRAHLEELETSSRRSEGVAARLHQELLASRMRPFMESARVFPRLVRDLARRLGKKAVLEIRGEQVLVDRDVLRALEAPLNHVVRNCVDHAIEPPAERVAAGKPETGTIVLSARHHAGQLVVEVRDDGRGIDVEKVRRRLVERGLAPPDLAAGFDESEVIEFLFLPGFTTTEAVTEVSGRGVGLDVVRTMVHQAGGSIRATTRPGRGTSFMLRLPVTRSVVRAAIVSIAGEPFGLPLAGLTRILRVPRDELATVEGRLVVALDDDRIGVVDAAKLLGLGTARAGEDAVVVVLGAPGSRCGLLVDGLLGETDLVVRPLDPRLGRVPDVAAAAVLEDGAAVILLDADDVARSVIDRIESGSADGMRRRAATRAAQKKRILVAEDSLTVREVERQLLLRHGWDVEVASDGREAWKALLAGPFDLLVTDVDMPRMNGIELLRTLRADPRFAALPVVIVSYKGRDEDRRLGLEAGANAYLTKGAFHDESFARVVADLLGEAT